MICCRCQKKRLTLNEARLCRLCEKEYVPAEVFAHMREVRVRRQEEQRNRLSPKAE